MITNQFGPHQPRELPHSIEAEQALLGAIMANGDALDTIDNIVTADDFYEPIHRDLFILFVNAHSEGRRISWQLVNAMLPESIKSANLGNITGKEYLARLAADAVSVIHARDFARVIADHADRRAIITVSEGMAAEALNTSAPPGALATDAVNALDSVANRHAESHLATVSFAKASVLATEKMQRTMQCGGQITGIPSCLDELDCKINGWQRGTFNIVAGRPGMGKSRLIISSCRQTAEKGHNVLLFSLEMTAESVAERMLSDACYRTGSPIEYFDIQNGRVTNQQAEATVLAGRERKDLPLTIDPQGGLSIAQIAARARRHKQRLERDGKTLDLVVIDHLHLVKASGRYSGHRVHEVSEISGAIKPLAKELNCPIVALAQLSRGVESRDDKRLVLSDLRDSGSLEQDADTIILLYREAYYLERASLSDQKADEDRVGRASESYTELEAMVAKQRNGPTGLVKLFFDPGSNAARNGSLIEMERARQ